ncbi:DUF1848 domain-containing protein [Yanshouia hominis]|uniref:DUF1848 domain-containing protein n=1 Tax=Yanshouia hominis TaxID=2763673 RepID=A0ABR7NMY6_9FIRM|nr:DUF1848 domain-containing protein [Yanshouia hominis]MBC8577772.1 DUF1848 domain-containing protein [Yanshouia hominis]
MVISASRRTDIPAFYSQWFINRLKEGYALIPNSRNADRIGRVELSPDRIDCIVFWTKNPIPMINRLDELDEMGYRYYFQFTLTPYETRIERNLPPKSVLLQAFIELAERAKSEGVVWRYDPIFIDREHSLEWHIEQFSSMCRKLRGYTKRCVISFIDSYKSTSHSFRAMTDTEISGIASGFSKIAREHGIKLFTCAEVIDLSAYGILHSSCIDKGLVEQVAGYRIKAKKDANQRAACCCIESVDIGAYDTCPNGCTYCYATTSQKTVLQHFKAHDPKAPMLTGYPTGNEIVTDRTTPSQKENQMSLFEWEAKG